MRLKFWKKKKRSPKKLRKQAAKHVGKALRHGIKLQFDKAIDHIETAKALVAKAEKREAKKTKKHAA